MIKVIKDKTSKKSLGYGFVKFYNVNDAHNAVQALNGFSIGNKQLKVSVARPPSLDIRNCKLYVSNLPKTYTESDIIALFQTVRKIPLLLFIFYSSSSIFLTRHSLSHFCSFSSLVKSSSVECLSTITQMKAKVLPSYSSMSSLRHTMVMLHLFLLCLLFNILSLSLSLLSHHPNLPSLPPFLPLSPLSFSSKTQWRIY